MSGIFISDLDIVSGNDLWMTMEKVVGLEVMGRTWQCNGSWILMYRLRNIVVIATLLLPFVDLDVTARRFCM